MTSKDVTSVDYSRMLKRNGAPQETQAYWQGIIPSLTTIQGMSAIAQEDKGKFRWLLVIGKPPEPNASAYTLEELENYLKGYMATNKTGKPYPELRKEKDMYVCKMGDRDLFNGKTEADTFVQAILYVTKL